MSDAAPFLKWVGGKSKLVPWMEDLFPTSWEDYGEPFLGGGAVFFRLASGRTDGTAYVSDANEELINAYLVVQSRVEELITCLSDESTYRYDKAQFYAIRSREPVDPLHRAARTIFLNRTCFNGLYRVNKSGKFNVPFGRYTNPVICNADLLRACSEALSGVVVEHLGFRQAIDRFTDGDFLYFDPPYVPTSKTSFTGYTADGFGTKDHVELFEALHAATSRGVRWALSSSDSYGLEGRYLEEGWMVHRSSLIRSVGASKRGRAQELLITNYEADS